MGCGTCANNDGSGTPTGCKNNGTCSSGGCNKLEVFDWLANMELPSGQKQFDCVEVRFKNGRKVFCQNVNNLNLKVGDAIAIESSPGYDIGVVTVVGEMARLQMSKKKVAVDSADVKKIYRQATEADIEKWQEARELENDTMHRARKMAVELNLVMKISDVEYQGDKSKATFYYTAEDRVDFRELIKIMADTFKVRIEMRQIGARQEASRLGGIGSCGRELCCSTWLTDFRSVSTSAARYQQLSLNPQKLAGQCGKLKCCLNYELDMYLEVFKQIPSVNTKLATKKGTAICIKIDIFKRMMWFVLEGQFGIPPVALSAKRVQDVLDMNKNDEKPDDLNDYTEVVIDDSPDYDNVVGQDSLTRFDSKSKGKARGGKRRSGGGKGPQAKGGGGNPRQGAKGNSEGGVQAKQDGQPKSQGQGGGRNKRRKPGGGGSNTQNPQGQKRSPNKPRPSGGGPRGKSGGDKGPANNTPSS